MESKALFVDFMYAVAVGATLPRLDEKSLHLCNPLFWALFFMIAVFLEDFYLYHAKVVPLLSGFPSWRGFVLTMSIICTWYVSQAAFPSNPMLFLLAFAFFFILKLVGGISMKAKSYPAGRDLLFLMPISAAVILSFFSDGFLGSHPGGILLILSPVWIISVATWWIFAHLSDQTKSMPVSSAL